MMLPSASIKLDKVAMWAAEGRANAQNSQNNAETKVPVSYNGSVSNSLDSQTTDGDLTPKSFWIKKRSRFRPEYDWHTGLTKEQITKVEEALRRAGSPDEKRITNTACWYKGRLEGQDLFVIYSTEDAEPTVMYLVKGENAKTELNILLDLLEESENGDGTRTRADGKSIFTQRLSQRNWVQNVDGGQNNFQRLGTG